eukprot:255675-Pelagomonas_calceolata.AAC.8
MQSRKLRKFSRVISFLKWRMLTRSTRVWMTLFMMRMKNAAILMLRTEVAEDGKCYVFHAETGRFTLH